MQSQSIHPRAVNGVTIHEKRNTSKPNRASKGHLRKVEKKFDRRIKDYEETIGLVVRTTKLNEEQARKAYRKPGSRRIDKI